MKLLLGLVLLTLAHLGLLTNLSRLIKRLDVRLSQLVKDRYAGSLTYLTAIKQMNSALLELAELIANPRSNSGILRLGQAVISSGTPHFVKYKIPEEELIRRYKWTSVQLQDYYELINKTIASRKQLDNICRKVSLEYKVYKYYYNNRQQIEIKANRTRKRSKQHYNRTVQVL